MARLVTSRCARPAVDGAAGCPRLRAFINKATANIRKARSLLRAWWGLDVRQSSNSDKVLRCSLGPLGPMAWEDWADYLIARPWDGLVMYSLNKCKRCADTDSCEQHRSRERFLHEAFSSWTLLFGPGRWRFGTLCAVR